MLITAETVVQQGGEILPSDVLNATLDRLEPASGRVSEVMCGHPNPDGRMHRVHFEMILSASNPEFRIVTIKLGEQHLR
jgi:hypothetical protein